MDGRGGCGLWTGIDERREHWGGGRIVGALGVCVPWTRRLWAEGCAGEWVRTLRPTPGPHPYAVGGLPGPPHPAPYQRRYDGHDSYDATSRLASAGRSLPARTMSRRELTDHPTEQRTHRPCSVPTCPAVAGRGSCIDLLVRTAALERSGARTAAHTAGSLVFPLLRLRASS